MESARCMYGRNRVHRKGGQHDFHRHQIGSGVGAGHPDPDAAPAGQSDPRRPPLSGASVDRCRIVGQRGGAHRRDRPAGRRRLDPFKNPARPERLGALCKPRGHVRTDGHHVRGGPKRSRPGQPPDVLPAEVCRHQGQALEPDPGHRLHPHLHRLSRRHDHGHHGLCLRAGLHEHGDEAGHGPPPAHLLLHAHPAVGLGRRLRHPAGRRAQPPGPGDPPEIQRGGRSKSAFWNTSSSCSPSAS